MATLSYFPSQVKGYGTRLMKELKEYNLCNRIVYLLTYADNNAIGYFEKQGFIDNFNLHKSVYQDYIQMYDESLLMACRIRNDGKVWAKPRPPPVDKPNDNLGENHSLVDKPNDNLREKPSEAVRPSQVQEVDSTEDHQQGEGQQNEQDQHKQDQHEQDQHEQQQHQEQQHVEVVAMPSSNKEQSNVQEKVDNSDSENDKQAAEDAEVEAGPIKQNFAIQWAITCVDCNKLPCSCEMILPG